jgi:hypothetical protein
MHFCIYILLQRQHCNWLERFFQSRFKIYIEENIFCAFVVCSSIGSSFECTVKVIISYFSGTSASKYIP